MARNKEEEHWLLSVGRGRKRKRVCNIEGFVRGKIKRLFDFLFISFLGKKRGLSRAKEVRSLS